MKTELLNGFDVDHLKRSMAEIAADASKAKVKFRVTTDWMGGTRSTTHARTYELAGEPIERGFDIPADEPAELEGSNTAANPQELLMAGFNACMLVGYITGASMRGIRLDKLEIETEGQLDLRGFLGLDTSVKPGYDEIAYTVTISGDGAPEQFQQIHETVIATSPNRYNLARPIRLNSKLVVE